MVESSDKMWFTEEEKSKPLQYSCLEDPINSMKRQKYMTLQDETLGWYVSNILLGTGDYNSRKNEGAEPKQKQCTVVDVFGGKSKVRCCKEQYYIGTLNVRSMNQWKLVKREMARVIINILEIRQLTWMGMAKFN